MILLPVKLSRLIFFTFLLISVLCSFSWCSLSIAVALRGKSDKLFFTFAFAYKSETERQIIKEDMVIQRNKTDKKIFSKEIKTENYSITKLESSQYWKKYQSYYFVFWVHQYHFCRMYIQYTKHRSILWMENFYCYRFSAYKMVGVG